MYIYWINYIVLKSIVVYVYIKYKIINTEIYLDNYGPTGSLQHRSITTKMYRNPKLHSNITCTKCNDPNISSLPWLFKVNGLPCYFYVTTLPANKISSLYLFLKTNLTQYWNFYLKEDNDQQSVFRIQNYLIYTENPRRFLFNIQ